jgi:hypothetical protein
MSDSPDFKENLADYFDDPPPAPFSICWATFFAVWAISVWFTVGYIIWECL